MPILLTNKDALPTSVANYLQANAVSQTYILGGTGVIDKTIEEHVPGPTRLAGNDRYETNLAIIEHFTERLNWETIYVATGNEFPDGITGGVLAAQTASPLIITGQTLSPTTVKYLKTKMLTSSKVIVLGGEGAVPASVLAEINALRNSLK